MKIKIIKDLDILMLKKGEIYENVFGDWLPMNVLHQTFKQGDWNFPMRALITTVMLRRLN